MGMLLQKLSGKKILISDGAWGTMLQTRGMTADDCPEEWNISHPDDVRAVAQAYVDAGVDMVLTNTFGGSRVKLDKKQLGDKVNGSFNEYNELGVLPHHVHKSKNAHKRAIFTLGKEIAVLYSHARFSEMERVAHRMERLMTKI